MGEYTMGFNNFMRERKEVDRWFVLKVALVGAFSGALLAVAFMTIALGLA